MATAHTVAPLTLGQEHALVGDIHQLGGVLSVIGVGRPPDAGREPATWLLLLALEGVILHARPQPLGHDRRAVRPCLREDDDELLAAVAGDEIARTVPTPICLQIAEEIDQGLVWSHLRVALTTGEV